MMRLSVLSITPVVFVSILSNIIVFGFTVPYVPSPLTILRYHHHSYFGDVKAVNVPVDANDDPQLIYIPLQEMETTIEGVQEEHKIDYQNLKNIIEEQRRELNVLQEKTMINVLKEKMRYDHLSTDSIINWNENQGEKMKRSADRMRYLIDENVRLQKELDIERGKFEHEKENFQRKLEESSHQTLKAEQLLSLERSYFETATKLLEIRLESETKNVKFLEEQLIESKRTFASSSSVVDNDNSPSIETWDVWTDANDCDQDYYYHKEVAPQVMSPQEAAEYQEQQQQCSQDNFNYPTYHDEGAYFHQEILHQEQNNYNSHSRTEINPNPHVRSTTPFTTTRPERPTATTTVMEMSSQIG